MYRVLEWLYQKSVEYQDTLAASKVAKFVQEMEAWDQYEYESSDDELDFLAKKEDYGYLKYHKIKKS